MINILILFALCLSIGLFLLLLDLLKIPTIKSQKVMTGAVKNNKKGLEFDSYITKWANKLALYIPMDSYKESRLQKTLMASGIMITAKEYIAYAYLKTGLISLGLIPCVFIAPLLAIAVLLLAVMVYFKEIKKADDKLKTKREKIEYDLPRFVASISQELKSSRDVLSIINHFKSNASDAFKDELNVLIADMRSSSYETALTRFETRVNSTMLSDTVRGLIGVLRGDDSIVYFQMLSHDMKELELQRLKKEAQKVPSRIRIFSFIMLLCFIITYIVVIGCEIMNSLGTMF